MKLFVLLCLACLALPAYSLFPWTRKQNTQCPPDGFDAADDFDPELYINHTWYVQEQIVVAYLAENTFHCVLATYEQKNGKDFTDGITVYNYANVGKVNGSPIGSGASSDSTSFLDYFQGLDAIIPDLDKPSKLLVGPTFIRTFTPDFVLPYIFGPYWVVAVSKDEAGDYKWAIISAGAPEVETDKGCVTEIQPIARTRVNGAGLWLFTRKPSDPESVAEMKDELLKLGYDPVNLRPVEHEGCKYDKAILK